MDVSTLATIAAGVGVIGVMAYALLPREEDHLERSMAELFALTSGSGRPFPGGPESGGRAVQFSHKGAPVSFIRSGQSSK